MKAVIQPSEGHQEEGGWGDWTTNSGNYLMGDISITGKPRAGACFKVEVEQSGGMLDKINGKENLHVAIWANIHFKHFHPAKEAPLCSIPLRGGFGYNTVTSTAKAILERTYVYPPEFDEATKEILHECALICLCITRNSMFTTITPEYWNQH